MAVNLKWGLLQVEYVLECRLGVQFGHDTCDDVKKAKSGI